MGAATNRVGEGISPTRRFSGVRACAYKNCRFTIFIVKAAALFHLKSSNFMYATEKLPDFPNILF